MPDVFSTNASRNVFSKQAVSKLDLIGVRNVAQFDAVSLNKNPIDFGVVPSGETTIRRIDLKVIAETALKLKIKGSKHFKAELFKELPPDIGKPVEHHEPILVNEYVSPIDIVSGLGDIFFHTGEFGLTEKARPRLLSTEIKTARGKQIAFRYSTPSLQSFAAPMPPPQPPPPPVTTSKSGTLTVNQNLLQDAGSDLVFGDVPAEEDNVFPNSQTPYFISVSFDAPNVDNKIYSAILIVSFDDKRVEIPLSAQTGNVAVALQTPNAPAVKLGDAALLSIQINNLSNVSAKVTFPDQLKNYGVTIPAQSWTVPANGKISVSLVVNTKIAYFYDGLLPLQLAWTASFGSNTTNERTLDAALLVSVKPPIVVIPGSLAALQGAPAQLGVSITSQGPATAFYFYAQGLPDGVTMAPTTVSVSSGQSTMIYLVLDVGKHAAITLKGASVSFTVFYSAYGDTVKSSKAVTLTIENGFEMQWQEQSNWCWAAATASVLDYYGGLVKQCTLADKFVAGGGCCNNPLPVACDAAQDTSQALNFLGLLGGQLKRALTLEEIIGQIDANQPVVLRITWAAGGAHAIAITGYVTPTSGATLLIVEDPAQGSSDAMMDLPTLMNYQGVGTWERTYLTKAPATVSVDTSTK